MPSLPDLAVPRRPDAKLAAGLASLLLACSQLQRPDAGTTSLATVAAASEAPEVAPVRSSAAGATTGQRQERARAVLVDVEVPGYLPALLQVPAGDDERPLVAAAHGAGGAPEWECEYWRRLVGEQVFVLCLRGTRMGEGAYYFKQHHALAEELDRATAAARARYPRIARTSGIYAGFSQGASMGSLMIAERAQQYRYVVLIEGFVQWNLSLGQTFTKRGGGAVLWACGTRDCAAKAIASAESVGRAGARVQVEHVAGAGHTPAGQVMDAVRSRLPWLVQGDPLWRHVSLVADGR